MLRTTTYDFAEYDVRSERMQLIKDRDFDAYFEEVDKLISERQKAAARIIEMMADSGCVMVRPLRGAFKRHRYYVHPNPGGIGIRITAWDDLGPIWHEVIFDGAKGLEKELPDRAFTASVKVVA